MYIWIEIKEIMTHNEELNLESSIDFIKMRMRKMADEFYDKFKNTSIPVVKDTLIYEKYNTVGIIFKDGSGFAVPYFFYQQLQAKTSVDYTNVFNKNLPWLDLLSEIYEKTFSIKSPLSKADIKILRALCFYKRNGLFNNFDFVDQKNFIFQIKNLSKIINLSYRWTIGRINYLVENYILLSHFILNPFLFGLKTYLLSYDPQFDDEISYLNSITLFKLNLSYKEVIRIIQLPNIQAPTDLNFSFSYELTKISEMNIFNNLSGLSEDPKKSFTTIPNFDLTKVKLSKPIIEFKESISTVQSIDFNDIDEAVYPLLNKMTNTRRISIIVRILNYLAKWRSVQGSLSKASKELRINPLEFLETCKFLFNNDVIGFFPRISRIGCNNRYGIVIKDYSGEKSAELMNIYYNFLELPQSVVFIGENLLYAYVTMPDNYISAFIKYMSSLHSKFEVKYNSFITLKSWGRFNIPLPEGTTVDEYGVNFPAEIYDKFKAKSLL